MKFKLIFFISAICLSYASKAQVVSGMVADQKHEPLIGATVLELGTQNGAVTDINGRFQLTLVDKSSKLVVSFTGFKSDTLAADLSKQIGRASCRERV